MEFKTKRCQGIIQQKNSNRDIQIRGNILDEVKDKKIFFIAANGTDRRASFSGSGLPFANQQQAFESTPNIGEVELDYNNSFLIDLITPNSYLVGLGSVTIPPSLFIEYFRLNGEKRIITIKVAEPIPYRTLTYPLDPRPRANATFFDTQFSFPVKTQEQHFYDSAYPSNNKTETNFWGLKYPN